MPADAFMELQDPAVWGETMDEQYGPQGRNLGAFEIFGFDFTATSNREEDDPSTKAAAPGASGAPAATGGAKGAAVHSQPVVKNFTIKKFIDKASPDLLLACCKAGMPGSKKIEWAIISVRETGDVSKKPYLILEFQGLWVESFTWAMSPGQGGDSAQQEETIVFSFETILIKYLRQMKTGEHTRVKIKGFDRVHPENDVGEIDHISAAVETY
jgi:type VI secretion system Hcp family effector